MAMLSPATSSLISRQAGEQERGGIMGVAQSASSLARIVGPAVAGFAYAGWGRDTPYYLGAIVMAGVVLMALPLPRLTAAHPKPFAP
jgi:DHA1 family tetracycline resistance protein-like MFS transporter